MANLGTDKIKVILSLGMAFGKQFETASADGKLDWKDIPGFIPIFLQVQGAIESGKEALAQALDLTQEDRTELNAWAQTEFDLTNDVVEAKVKAALDLAISFLVAYSVFKPKGAMPQG